MEEKNFLKLIKNKIDIKDYVWNKYLEKLNFSDPYEISRFEKYIKNLSYNNIKDIFPNFEKIYNRGLFR